MTLIIGSASLAGGRKQQDAVRWRYVTSGEHPEDRYVAAVVCDGVGSGEDSGPIANTVAAVAVNAVAEYGAYLPELALHTARETAVDLHPEAGGNDNTCTVAAGVDEAGNVEGAWIGDCRASLLTRGGKYLRMSRDHNRGGRFRHILTRVLIPENGYRPETGDEHTPETFRYDATAAYGFQAARVLLTSDGVHDVLTDDQIRWVLLNVADPDRAARKLTEWAVRGVEARQKVQPDPYFRGADNATAIVVDVRPPKD